MQKNVLIGIGGTGSRVIESIVHLCAAGLGPDKLNIMIIDPDEGNGNLTRTKSLINVYNELRTLFQRVDNPCFRTEIIIPPDGEPFIWNIFEERGYTLAKYIDYSIIKNSNPDLKDLADVLFTQSELQTELNEGFRGHPSIGAVVMADPPMDKYPFKLLWDDIASLRANDLGVFIVGSIFGGTGAAGFPTLGAPKLIKYNEAMQARLSNNKSKVLLGGALILPYFSFSTDNLPEGQLFVTSKDFPIATKAALQYYNDKQLAFDQYYFIGDSLLQKVGEFSPGSSTQENLPHYIEMVSSLAAFDFYGQEKPEDLVEKQYFIASREDDKIDWDSLPITREGAKMQDKKKELKDRITDFAVFAYTYLTYGKSILKKSHNEILTESWYGDNFKKFDEGNFRYNPRHEDNKRLQALAEEYLESYLFWICALSDGDNIHLIDKDKILDKPLKIGEPISLINPENAIADIGRIVKGRTNNETFYAFKKSGLNESIIKDETISAGSKFLNIFYSAAFKFNQKNSAIK